MNRVKHQSMTGYTLNIGKNIESRKIVQRSEDVVFLDGTMGVFRGGGQSGGCPPRPSEKK